MTRFAGTATVFAKEMVDALRDRRTLVVVLLSSVLLGPLVLIALSGLVASFEARAEKREVFVLGIEHAPEPAQFSRTPVERGARSAAGL